MKKIISVITVLISIFLINIYTAYSCSCMMPESTEISLNKSSSVFVGKVIEVEKSNNFGNSLNNVNVKLNVTEIFKGENLTELNVKTSSSSASCGFNFEESEEYLIYANKEDNDLTVSLCSRTTSLQNAQQDLNELRELNTSEFITSGNNEQNYNDKIFDKILIIVVLLTVVGLFFMLMFKSKKKKKQK